MTNENILLTGVTGGLGRSLVGLVGDARSIIGVSRAVPTDLGLARWHQGDVTKIDWKPLLEHVETVFHLAAFVHRKASTDVDRRVMYEVNEMATRRLAQSCRETGTKLVFASTIAVYGAQPQPLTEDTAPLPVTDYGRSKLAAERAIMDEVALGLRAVIIRFPLLYGRYGRGNVERMVSAILRRRYWPVGDQAVPKAILHLRDAAAALLLAERTPVTEGGTYLAAPPRCPSLGDIHRAAYTALHRPIPRAIPTGMATAAASLVDVAVRFAGRQPRFREQVRVLVAPSVCDGARFARATGFRPEVGLEDGMRDAAAAFL